MRLSLALFLFMIAVAGCAQPKATIKSIAFSKSTRGYEQRVSITSDSVHTWTDNRRESKAANDMRRRTTKEEWTSAVSTAQQLNLNEFSSLPSPTMKRASDAAMHSTITITTSDGKSYSHGFDDENPHVQVVPLLKKILEISGADNR